MGNNEYNELTIKMFIEYLLDNYSINNGLNNIELLQKRLSEIKISSNTKKSPIIINVHDYILDIEDLCKQENNILPPCIKKIQREKVHLKNFDRMILGNYFFYTGITDDEIDKLITFEKDNKEIKSQHKLISNDPSKYFGVPCTTIIEGKHNECFTCVYKDKKIKDTTYQDKMNIIKTCQDLHGTYHYSPVSYTHTILQEMNKIK